MDCSIWKIVTRRMEAHLVEKKIYINSLPRIRSSQLQWTYMSMQFVFRIHNFNFWQNTSYRWMHLITKARMRWNYKFKNFHEVSKMKSLDRYKLWFLNSSVSIAFPMISTLSCYIDIRSFNWIKLVFFVNCLTRTLTFK